MKTNNEIGNLLKAMNRTTQFASYLGIGLKDLYKMIDGHKVTIKLNNHFKNFCDLRKETY